MKKILISETVRAMLARTAGPLFNGTAKQKGDKWEIEIDDEVEFAISCAAIHGEEPHDTLDRLLCVRN